MAFAPGARATNKYSAKRCEIDGLKFASLREGRRYTQLKAMQEAGLISDLRVHGKDLIFRFVHNGVKIGRYTPDFKFLDCASGKTVYEDCKSPSTRTEAYVLRRQLMLAFYGIEIVET